MKLHLLRKPIILIIFSIILMALSPISNGSTVYYYNLKFLKKSSPPKKITLVNTSTLILKTKPISKGVLFTYKNRSAKKVKIAGNFSDWRTISMKRSDNGVWYHFQRSEYVGIMIHYKFMIDGIWIYDPQNQTMKDDGIGSYLSLIDENIEEEEKDKKHATYRKISEGLVEFRIYKPHAKLISLVGDFNNWNPENDLLKPDKDGVWGIKKIIIPGTYRYKFIIDGKWVPDVYNSQSAVDPVGEPCSLINVN